GKFPPCKSAKITTDQQTGQSPGYGFVLFSDEQDQQRALSEMQGVYYIVTSINGKWLIAKPLMKVRDDDAAQIGLSNTTWPASLDAARLWRKSIPPTKEIYWAGGALRAYFDRLIPSGLDVLIAGFVCKELPRLNTNQKDLRITANQEILGGPSTRMQSASGQAYFNGPMTRHRHTEGVFERSANNTIQTWAPIPKAPTTGVSMSRSDYLPTLFEEDGYSPLAWGATAVIDLASIRGIMEGKAMICSEQIDKREDVLNRTFELRQHRLDLELYFSCPSMAVFGYSKAQAPTEHRSSFSGFEMPTTTHRSMDEDEVKVLNKKSTRRGRKAPKSAKKFRADTTPRRLDAATTSGMSRGQVSRRLLPNTSVAAAHRTSQDPAKEQQGPQRGSVLSNHTCPAFTNPETGSGTGPGTGPGIGPGSDESWGEGH
ncbi:Uu.00g000010.m01.CDS01, partial [Anthostomella pinea]